MSVLLDTHYVYGIAESPGTISEEEAYYLKTFAARLVVSAVSIWEVRLKWNAFHRSGVRKGVASPSEVVRTLLGQPVDMLALSAAHAAADLLVPLSHKDPFDELLLAQAQVEGLKLLSRDRQLVGHPLVVTIS
jgi:PIN domain nuclease of toxin-antitoxin system